MQLMKRVDKGEGIITLRHNDGTDSWLVVRRQMVDADQVRPTWIQPIRVVIGL